MNGTVSPVKPERETENTTTAGTADDGAEQPGPVLSWTAHPLKRRPLVSIAVSVFILGVASIVYYLMTSVGFALLAFVALFASLAKFYFPTHYRLDDEGVTIKTRTQTLKKPWRLYRTVYPDKNGVFLSPFVKRTRLENFRGMYLMCENNRDEVTAFVQSHVTQARQPKTEAGSDDTVS